MPSGKRTRFGLVFDGVRPPSMGGGFLKELDVIKAEGCEKDGKQFLIFTTNKPRRSNDVADSVRAFNESAPDDEKLALIAFENGPEVVVFERGNCFRTHPISKIIQGAMEDDGYWAWSVMIDGDRKKKRAVNELESDLVEAAIRPSSAKRVAVLREDEVILSCVIGELRWCCGHSNLFYLSSYFRYFGSDSCIFRLGPMWANHRRQ